MYLNAKEKIEQLPPQYKEELLTSIRELFIKSEKTIVVLDDDPTGTQTCYDVTVITSWNKELIAEELKKKPAILFILTNSRSLPENEAIELAGEIGSNLKKASSETGREILVISRSDSTLRGHFPAEVYAVAEALDIKKQAVIVLIPAFIEGKRFTIDDVHYIQEDEFLVPVSETPFAKDTVFGYQHANLKMWVEEKTKGQVKASDVNSISIDDIRIGGPELVCKKLKACGPGSVCIINAVSYRDLEVAAMGLMMPEKDGRIFLYRSSATIVPIRAGMESGKIFIPGKNQLDSKNGALVIAGSHVPKTTQQLEWLLASGKYKSIEVNVSDILSADELPVKLENIIHQTDQWIASGKNVVIYTSRKLETGQDAEGNLKINAAVSDFLVRIMNGLKARPKFIIAKGGITSSDLATKGLAARRATVLGPVVPGVPVWQMDAESKFPGIMYVVFPGNVGDQKALAEVCKKLDDPVNE